jgi:pimeloyl-ACP methyl ester carboxylesterase
MRAEDRLFARGLGKPIPSRPERLRPTQKEQPMNCGVDLEMSNSPLQFEKARCVLQGLRGKRIGWAFIHLLTLALILFSGCTDRSQTDVDPEGMKLEDCELRAPGRPGRIEARCGTFEVPEDWDKPDGRKLRLHVAVVPAKTDKPRADPLFFLAGGPGQAASESFSSGFEQVRRHRAIVLVDQRGTGRSNPLTCDALSNLDPFVPIPEEEEHALFKACVDSFQVDLATFTTTATVRDLDAVRSALGYDTINLYGISYGTRVALSFLAQYPDRVRSTILDGVIPQDVVLGPEILSEGPARARATVVRRCQMEPACAKRFPNLPRDFDVLEERLRTDPPKVRFAHPRTGEDQDVELDWELWTSLLRFLGYASETGALMPLLVHRAAHGDFAPLTAQSVLVHDALASILATRLENSVLCSEEVPFFPPGTVVQKGEAGEPRYGARALRSLERVCKFWPTKPVPASFKQPVRASSPVLLLSGEYDPVTTPDHAERARATLSKSRHVVVPKQGHGVIGRGCVPRLAATFLETLDPEGLDTSCVASALPLGSFLDFAGPTP